MRMAACVMKVVDGKSNGLKVSMWRMRRRLSDC